MTLWDGLTSSNEAGVPARIVVLGATNRIHDIDEAILRRMPKKFAVPLPGLSERRRILQLVLQGAKTDPDPASFDVDLIARITDGMSGSDLKEACRDAAMVPMRELLREQAAAGRPVRRIDPALVRGIRSDDFFPKLRQGSGGGGGQNSSRALPPANTAPRAEGSKAAARRRSAPGPAPNRRGSGDEYEDAVDTGHVHESLD